MRLPRRRTSLFVGIAGGVAFFMLVAVVLGLSSKSNPSENQGGNIILQRSVASCLDARIQAPSTSCVEVSIAQSMPVRVDRCGSVAVQLRLNLSQGAGGIRFVTLHLIGEGRVNSSGVVLRNGTHFSFNQFMKYSPSEVSLNAGSPGDAILTISLPCDFPQELIGKMLQFDIVWSVGQAPLGSVTAGIFSVQSSFLVVVI